MNQKELIKYGLIALGAYLVWKYVQDHGGIEGLLGTSVSPHPGCPAGQQLGSDGKCFTIPVNARPGTTPDTAPPPIPPQPCPDGQYRSAAGQCLSIPTRRVQPVPVLDMSGLVVMQDVNDSLSGTVKINGIPIRLSIITGDGRIFDSNGSEVADSLQSQGIDIVALRNAFQAAPVVGVSITSQPELAGLGTWTPPWLM
jgi:hypothetical protein